MENYHSKNFIKFILENIVKPRIIRTATKFYIEFGDLKGMGQILHELIKRELIRICQEIGLIPFPEIDNPKKEDEGVEKKEKLIYYFGTIKRNSQFLFLRLIVELIKRA